MNGPFDAAALGRHALAATVELHESIGSTNDRAKQLAASRTPPPVLVVADRQTAGRGRGKNRWHASAGSLTFSLLIDPSAHGVATERLGLLSLATGVAVIDAVRATTGIACGFKWPNDVHLDGKKLAGVLLECPRPDRLVLGVGLNVATRFDDAPTDVRDRATSLHAEGATSVTRQQALEAFLAALGERLAQLAANDPRPVNDARAACVLTGRSMTVEQNGAPISGYCRGLEEDGSLILETGAAVQRLVAGTVVSYR